MLHVLFLKVFHVICFVMFGLCKCFFFFLLFLSFHNFSLAKLVFLFKIFNWEIQTLLRLGDGVSAMEEQMFSGFCLFALQGSSLRSYLWFWNYFLVLLLACLFWHIPSQLVSSWGPITRVQHRQYITEVRGSF